MLTLYIRPDCPFSHKAMDAFAELEVPYEKKDINEAGVSEELRERGGYEQVPFLYGEEGDVNIYESDSIIRYLHEHFGKDAVE